MKKQIKAIMLPTVDKTNLIFNDANHLCYQSNKSFKNDRKSRKRFHIYITSDEEIKEGDHVLSTAQDYNMQVVPKHSVKTYNDVEHYFKIIATSDDNIRHCKQCGGKQELNMDGVMQFTHINKCVSFSEPLLPNVQQSFLKAFVKSDGKEDWEIEMEGNMCNCKVYEESDGCFHCDYTGIDYYKLKLDSDNCVILSAVEEKMYCGEIVDIIEKYLLYVEPEVFKRTKRSNIYNWIKENL